MRISIVNGFFLPVPPVSGGSTEKTWHSLARAFADRGHQVVSISRSWPGFPKQEESAGYSLLRLPGYEHRPRLSQNLFLDFLWSWRVFRALRPADIVVCNALALPIWLRRLKPYAGRVVLMAGRMPKGQYRWYPRPARVMAPSSFVRERILAENPKLEPAIRVTGYPIRWSQLSGSDGTIRSVLPRPNPQAGVTIGFVGRLHREKGLLLLADAVKILRTQAGVPPFQVLLCGPGDRRRGGSGEEFTRELVSRLSGSLEPGRLHVLEPEFDEKALAGVYGRIDIFCYPSLAEEGETFGVAVAEAMAAGSVPVVSGLACFRDLVSDGVNGFSFDHSAADAPACLATALLRAISDASLRRRLAAQARLDSRKYDFPEFADRLLADFSSLAAN